MRSIGMVALAALSLSACDNAQAELEARLADLEVEKKGYESQKEGAESELEEAEEALSDTRKECEAGKSDAEARISELKSTITDKMGNVKRGGREGQTAAGHSWSIAIQELTPVNWSWREKEATVAGNRRAALVQADEIEYSVNPLRLNKRAEVSTYLGSPAVTIRCRDDKDCIKAKGKRVAAAFRQNSNDGAPKNSSIDEPRSHNVWVLRSDADSGKVAQAVSDLLEEYGKEDPVSCLEIGKREDKVSEIEKSIKDLERKVSNIRKEAREVEASGI